ncbi:hypothetical protein [Halomonas lysinitropha]|uniref:Uncharacterized protein n=1 Tax=Halomonas lysinitropha TaxID=2607506 RepID=A0A5K1I4B3_9GAMM|nr:hypothetical protein [Halomonas lysinitropha]VVZ95281.1 hypothetical protein HALO32_01346 [Halomonas lysinitropha]
MAKLRFPEIFGSRDHNDMVIDAFEVGYGLEGDEVLRGCYGSNYSFLAGGPGDDIYVAADWAALKILDSGGFHSVVADGISVLREGTYVATVEGRHLIAGDIYSGQQVAISNWEDPQFRIEEFVLADGIYSFDQIHTTVFSSPN